MPHPTTAAFSILGMCGKGAQANGRRAQRKENIALSLSAARQFTMGHPCCVKAPPRILTAIALLTIARAADDLPRRAPGEAMDFEPGLLLNGPVPADPVADVPRLEAALIRAKKSAAEGERLFRAGVIAKVEAEKRALKVVRLAAELAAARMESAKIDLTAASKDFDAGSISRGALDAAKAALTSAIADATAAATEWQRAELAAAELNLSRHRKLLAAGIGSRMMVKRAEAQVATLKSKPAPAIPEAPE